MASSQGGDSASPDGDPIKSPPGTGLWPPGHEPPAPEAESATSSPAPEVPEAELIDDDDEEVLEAVFEDDEPVEAVFDDDRPAEAASDDDEPVEAIFDDKPAEAVSDGDEPVEAIFDDQEPGGEKGDILEWH